MAGAQVDGIEITPDFRARFKLGDLLGAGAAGTVRSALHRDSGRTVAVKFLRRLGEPSLTERFLREARLLARVQHPNVLKVFELGEMSGHPFLVTALVSGGTLRQRLQRDGRLPAPEALRIAVACLDGLAACHAAGCVHRDMKPENVLIDGDGEPVIADLGIARCLEVHTSLTLPGTVMGTPRYMSPEQARGETVGPATDLYATGVMLYEMLAGAAPFNHTDVNELMKLQIHAPAPPLPDGDYPEGLVAQVADTLAKDVERRPPSAAVLAAALRRLLEPRPRPRTARTPMLPEGTPPADEFVSGAVRSLHTPPAPETRPLMIGACLAAGVMTFLALHVRQPVRPRPVAAVSASRPAPAAFDAAALGVRVNSLQRARQKAETRLQALRIGLEEDRRAAQLPDLRAALAEAEEDVRLTRELVRDLDAAQLEAGPADPQAIDVTRAFALQWLALARQLWLRQNIDLLTRRGDDWTRVADTGPESASAALLPVLKRWLAAAEVQLRRPASMPSMAGPELADLLDEVHAVAVATYALDWHPSAKPLLDQAAQTFLAGVGRLNGMAAPLLDKIVSDLWRWGHAEGAVAYAAGAIFEDNRQKTVEHLGSLASFLAPPAREAMQRFIERATRNFRAR